MAFKMKGWSAFKQTNIDDIVSNVKDKTISSVKDKISNKLDSLQTGLSVAGLTPGAGIIPDAINTAISGGRAGWAKFKGNKAGLRKHLKNLAINAGSTIPVIGQGVATTGLAANIAEKTHRKKYDYKIQTPSDKKNVWRSSRGNWSTGT